jgi:sulfite reductase (ferredoxin)
VGVEDIKIASRYLAGTIGDELERGDGVFGHDDVVVLKFHGIYQQDDRDTRRARTQAKLPLDHSCMVRASVPGGVISPDQWRSLDALADLGDGSLRLTTRQGVQYHVVHQGDLHDVVAGINRAALTTLAACGDVVRNVMACPLPDPARQAVLEPVVAGIVRRFRPRTESYWELWVDGERAVTAEPPPPDGPVEPIYGETYLPRKFKIGVAWPGDNCIDLHANDVAVVPTLTEGTSGELTGFVVFAGGGMGMTHARPDDTFPRLADPIGWVPPADLLDVIEAIVTTHRDHGDRTDRSRARLKYLVHDHGVEWLRDQIEARTGRPLAAPVELPPAVVHDHHGHAPGGLGDVYGLPVPSGRVAGDLRRALRAVVDGGLASELRVTARQDLLFVGVPDVAALEQLLTDHQVALPHAVSPARRLAIACPALPTCGQALGEAERALPALMDRLEKVLADTGNEGLAVRLNMTGCPNGCSRPYTADIGVVGRTKTTYDLYLGGSPAGDRLARLVRADVTLDDLTSLLDPLLRRFAADAPEGTDFGDWCDAHGPEALGTWLPAPTVRRRRRTEAVDA